MLGPEINPVGGAASAPSISADGSTLYFCAGPSGWTQTKMGQYDLWQATISPIVDLTGDGIVDLKDFSKLGQYWGQDESSVDMGPMPWGDGTVDIQDLTVLAEHWLEEIAPIAHW
jgi:hypothetical protein